VKKIEIFTPSMLTKDHKFHFSPNVRFCFSLNTSLSVVFRFRIQISAQPQGFIYRTSNSHKVLTVPFEMELFKVKQSSNVLIVTLFMTILCMDGRKKICLCLSNNSQLLRRTV
jgi:hypothetical protein